MAMNVLGTKLETCCLNPLTGFYRNGMCDTGSEDHGMHTVCVEMTEDFLKFAKESGNDLITAAPEYEFPGLKPGNRWCVCLGTVKEAIENDIETRLVLKSTHISALEFIDLAKLKQHEVADF